MKSIAELKQEIKAYDDVAVGAAQVLGDNWEYEITPDGDVLFLAYVGPETQRED